MDRLLDRLRSQQFLGNVDDINLFVGIIYGVNLFVGSAFFDLFAMMDCLGVVISCVPFRAGETEVLLELGLGGFNLVVATVELTSHVMEPSLPVRLSFLGVQKMCALLRAASVKLAFRSTIFREPQIS